MKVFTKIALALAAAPLLLATDATFVFAGLSMTPEPWNKSANFAKLERFAREAAAKGAQVIATPEGFLEGYVGNQSHSPGLTNEKYAAAGEELGGPLLTRASNLAKELKVYLLIGFAEHRDGKTFNSAVIFTPQGTVASHYSKSHTADDEPFNTKGTEFPVSQTAYGRWGTLICYDRQLPEPARILAVKGAEFILVPAWGSYNEMNDMRMRVRAQENGVWVAFVHPKRTLIIDPSGNVIAQGKGDRDQIVFGTVALRSDYPQNQLKRRRPELYGDLLR
ncbi:MAG: carbon-nitrogen hydrolase family protein [Bryobacteraceae bacterium]